MGKLNGKVIWVGIRETQGRPLKEEERYKIHFYTATSKAALAEALDIPVARVQAGQFRTNEATITISDTRLIAKSRGKC